MNKKLSYAVAMTGLTCLLSLPVMAATSETGSSTTPKSTMSAPDKDHSKHSKDSSRPKGENGAATKGTALPGSGGEAGSGGNSSPGNRTQSGAGSSSN